MTSRLEVMRLLDEAGIEIPFPQRDLRLRSVDASAAATLLSPNGAESHARRERSRRAWSKPGPQLGEDSFQFLMGAAVLKRWLWKGRSWFLKGRSFSCAVTGLIFCHPEEGFSPTRICFCHSDKTSYTASPTFRIFAPLSCL